jgi:WD40 repeat protein
VHAGKISGVAICGGNTISVGWDDTARVVPFGGAVVTAGVPLSGQPVGIAASPFGALAAVATLNGIQIFNGAEIVAELGGISYQPSSIAMLNQEEIAVGATDNKIYIYTLDGRTLALRREVTGHLGPVTALAYSPNGELLAAGDNTRAVNVWQRSDWTARVQGVWVYHTTRITALAWSPSGQFVASGSVDEQIIVWNLETPRQKGLALPFAHKDGVTGVTFLDEDHLISCGNDHCVCTWNLSAGEERK